MTTTARTRGAPDCPDGRPGVLMATGAYFPELSGAGLQCRALVREFGDVVRFVILTTTTDRDASPEDTVDGVPVYRVFVDPSSVWSKLTAAVRMTRIVLRERRHFAVMHLHGFSDKSILLVALTLLIGKRLAIKMTSVGHDDPESMRTRGRLAFWCYSRAHVFFGVSPRFQALYAASGLSGDRFRMIPNGVDLVRFRPACRGERLGLRRELGLPADATVILFVGFFSREKCPDLLFDAWARVVTAGDTRTVLVFVGATRSTYYEVDECLAVEIRERAARRGVDGRLHFVEATREIEDYQRAADIFVLPSVREGLPNALLEAMACGTACIATRLDGVTDTLIDDGVSGILTPPRDVTALKTALTRLISHPELAQAMGARARERVVRDFALANTARAYLAAYKELVAS